LAWYKKYVLMKNTKLNKEKCINSQIHYTNKNVHTSAIKSRRKLIDYVVVDRNSL